MVPISITQKPCCGTEALWLPNFLNLVRNQCRLECRPSLQRGFSVLSSCVATCHRQPFAWKVAPCLVREYCSLGGHRAERDGDISATSSQRRLFSLPNTSMTPRQRSAEIR